jgi:hypothetical protein
MRLASVSRSRGEGFGLVEAPRKRCYRLPAVLSIAVVIIGVVRIVILAGVIVFCRVVFFVVLVHQAVTRTPRHRLVRAVVASSAAAPFNPRDIALVVAVGLEVAVALKVGVALDHVELGHQVLDHIPDLAQRPLGADRFAEGMRGDITALAGLDAELKHCPPPR